MSAGKRVRMMGVPLDLGQGRRGVDMGPSALRVAGLAARLEALGYAVEDAGNEPTALAEMNQPGDQHAKYLREIAATCRTHAARVEATLAEGALPLVMGGDHSIAVGTVAGACAHFRGRQQRIGLLWLDAHGDFNTPETTPSGNIHGMTLACLLGLGPRELTHLGGESPMVARENAVLVGAHDLDAEERELLRAHGPTVFTMRDIDERGLRAVMEDAIGIATHGTHGLCCSLDMDFIDANDAPGVGTPVRGGATYREGHLAMEILYDSGRLSVLEVVEVNPILDERNRTAALAVELVQSALGKKIL